MLSAIQSSMKAQVAFELGVVDCKRRLIQIQGRLKVDRR